MPRVVGVIGKVDEFMTEKSKVLNPAMPYRSNLSLPSLVCISYAVCGLLYTNGFTQRAPRGSSCRFILLTKREEGEGEREREILLSHENSKYRAPF